MQHRKTLIASISSLILVAGTAQADVTTFDNVTGNNWDEPDNWDNGVPDATDRAVIPAGKTCNITDDAIADTMDVQGTLVIGAGFTLTLENDDDNGVHTDPNNSIVDGLVTIAGANSVLEFTNEDHGISGDGEINGQDNNARIEIEADIRFTSRLDVGGITGAMQIKGIPDKTTTGTFDNGGLVRATIDGKVLELHADTILEDHPTIGRAIWMSGGSVRPTLLFSRDASLNGDILLFCPSDAGRINMDASIDTCGDFLIEAGALKVFAGETFRYGGYAAISGNPGSQIKRGCLNWEIVSTDLNPFELIRTCD